jgi:hypothetical protein
LIYFDALDTEFSLNYGILFTKKMYQALKPQGILTYAARGVVKEA